MSTKAVAKKLRGYFDKMDNEDFPDVLTEIVSALEERYENMSESAQDGERGQALLERIDALAAVNDDIEQALFYLESAADKMEELS